MREIEGLEVLALTLDVAVLDGAPPPGLRYFELSAQELAVSADWPEDVRIFAVVNGRLISREVFSGP